MATQHPDFSRLAARISVSNLHKSTDKVFSDVVEKLHKHVHPKTKKPASLIADDVYEVIMSNKDKINGAIVYDRDFEYDYFGFKTLERSYLMRCDGDIAERPQHMIMRVAIGIHGSDVRSRRPRIAPEFNRKSTGRFLSWRRSQRDASRRTPTATSRETAAGRRRHRDLRAHVAEVLHARDADALQRRHAAAPALVLLPARDEGGLD